MLLLDSAQQEEFVVHREAECHNREQNHRGRVDRAGVDEVTG